MLQFRTTKNLIQPIRRMFILIFISANHSTVLVFYYFNGICYTYMFLGFLQAYYQFVCRFKTKNTNISTKNRGHSLYSLYIHNKIKEYSIKNKNNEKSIIIRVNEYKLILVLGCVNYHGALNKLKSQAYIQIYR